MAARTLDARQRVSGERQSEVAMSEVKYINVKEFREFGYLQELNRQFLHPMGLALSVEVDDDGEESLNGIWDYRDDPEGIAYGPEVMETEKADRVREEATRRAPDRQEALGYWIQPLF